ncbi:MAG: nicotinate-nucleotide adenylyltransferase [Candidatus Omnitrophica bacterium]|nr:nicotinate-nucleotide adenylyltransferase [Candidatus Omnitrophota bacterium]
MKIGILGGTFNPIHIGHLILADETREKLGLRKIIFVPTYLPPHKGSSDIAPASERMKMIRHAIAGNKNFSVSDVEILREGRSYTIDTIRSLKKKYPRDELYFIIGSDLLRYLREWKDLNEITKMVRFIAATRPGYPLKKLPKYIDKLSIRAVDISGYEIRACVRLQRSFRYLVPDGVFRYITEKGLYQ